MKMIEEMYFYFFCQHTRKQFCQRSIKGSESRTQKSIKDLSVNATFGFANAHSQRKKPKEPFFCQYYCIK